MTTVVLSSASAAESDIERDALAAVLDKIGLQATIIRSQGPVVLDRLHELTLEAEAHAKKRADAGRKAHPDADLWIGIQMASAGPGQLILLYDLVGALDRRNRWFRDASRGYHISQATVDRARHRTSRRWVLGESVCESRDSPHHGSIDDPLARLTDGRVSRRDSLIGVFELVLARTDLWPART